MTNQRILCLLLSGLSLVVSTADLSAQQPTHDAVLANGTDIRVFISSAGDKFKKRFVIDQRVDGRVELDGLTPDSLTYHAFLEILQARGIAAVPSGDVTTIVPNIFVRTLPTPIVSVDNIAGDDAEVVTILIPLKGADAVQLATALRPMVATYGFLTPLADQNALLMVDRVANVKRIVAIIRSKSEGH